MKFFHLSDLHIGLKLMNHDMREDQEYILSEVIEVAGREKPDAIVIAGDIYDKAVPSAEAVGVFDCFRKVLSRQNVYMVGQPPRMETEYIEKVVLKDEYGKVNFYLLPFVKPSMVKQVVGVDENGNNLSYNETLHRLIGREKINSDERNVLVSHQFYLPSGKNAEDVERMDSEMRTVGNIDEVSADVLEKFDYAALGHIHKPMKVGSELYRYCGTPLACSVSEAQQQKGIIMVEMGVKGEVKTTILPLEPLRQVKVVKGTLEEVLKESCKDYVTVILTDKADLDVIDMQERIRLAFPNLLEIRRENQRKTDYTRTLQTEELLDPYELCCSFLKDLDEEEKMILQDVLHTVQGVK